MTKEALKAKAIKFTKKKTVKDSLKDEREMDKARVIAAMRSLKESWINLLHDAGRTVQGSEKLAGAELKRAKEHLVEAEKEVHAYFKL